MSRSQAQSPAHNQTAPEPPTDWLLPPVPEEGKAEHTIAPESKQLEESDQGSERVTPSIAVRVLIEFEGMEVSPALRASTSWT